MDHLLAAFVSLLIMLAALATVVGIGTHVVRKYPTPYDPDRNRWRYVATTGLALGAAVAAFISMVVFLALAMIL